MRTLAIEQDIKGVDPNKEYGKHHIAQVRKHIAVSSNLTNFVLEMERVWRREGPGTKFYVAADRREAREELRDLVRQRGGNPDLVVYQRDACEDRTPKCIGTALVDLRCLGLTKKLVGSGWSSFTEVACRMARNDKDHAKLVGRDKWMKACYP